MMIPLSNRHQSAPLCPPRPGFISGILALIIIPQLSVSTEDAKLNTLKTNLTALRSTIEIYAAQHGDAYPGVAIPATKPADVTDLPTSFMGQLTRYTDVDGNVSNTKTSAPPSPRSLCPGRLSLRCSEVAGDTPVCRYSISSLKRSCCSCHVTPRSPMQT